jgi:CRP/FNR family transcriptional regulator, cyclic AMP receptor protein
MDKVIKKHVQTGNGRISPFPFKHILDGLGHRENVLARLRPEERQSVLECGVVKRFTAGQTIFSQTGTHGFSYFILKGVVRASYQSYNGHVCTVAYWTKDELVGGPYFLNDSSIYLWSAKAVELTEVLTISGTKLRALSLRMPSLAVAIIDALSYKIHWFSILLQIMATRSVDGRLAALLVGLGTAYGAGTSEGLLIRYPFTQSDLAEMIGSTRQWVNHTLGEFQANGVLSISHGRVLIRNLAALQDTLGPDLGRNA